MDCTTERRENLIDKLTEEFGEMLREWAQQAANSDPRALEGMEGQVRAGLQSLGQKALQGLVDLVGTGKSDESILCAECGEPMEFVRYQGKWLQTMLGTIRPERAYFHCGRCHKGFVPLDRQLGLGANSLSPGLEEALCLLSVHMSFEEAADLLARLALVKSDDNTVQRVALQVGTELLERQEALMEEVWQQSEPPSMVADEAPQRLYISVDGTTVHLEEGWKEVKVAAIYETESVSRPDGSDEIRAVNITYVVSFEKAEIFARHVYIEAVRRGLYDAEKVIILGDGAEWIWNHIASFCDAEVSVEIVDFYHASEHVWTAGQALYGEGTPQTEEWVNQRLKELLEESPDAMLSRFWSAAAQASSKAKEALTKEINYFNKHKHRMRYAELRAKGYHIGSGVVESACKRIIGGRLKQSGMIWSRQGARAIAQLRATVLSNRWDEFWACREPPARTYRRAA